MTSHSRSHSPGATAKAINARLAAQQQQQQQQQQHSHTDTTTPMSLPLSQHQSTSLHRHAAHSVAHPFINGNAATSNSPAAATTAADLQVEISKHNHSHDSNAADDDQDSFDPLLDTQSQFRTFDWSASASRLLTSQPSSSASAAQSLLTPADRLLNGISASNGNGNGAASSLNHAAPRSSLWSSSVDHASELRSNSRHNNSTAAAASNSSRNRTTATVSIWPLHILSRILHYLIDHPFWSHSITQSILQWLVLLTVGVVIGLLASLIDVCVHFLIDLRSGRCRAAFMRSRAWCPSGEWQEWAHEKGEIGRVDQSPTAYIAQYFVYCCLSVWFATASAWLIQRCNARWAAGSGICEMKVILGGVRNDAVLSTRTLLVKCSALVLSVSSGLSVGKEGPAIHIAACIGHACSRALRAFRLDARLHSELLSASCAAGVAAAFGAPIGGVLYSLEELSSFFPQRTLIRAFVCAIASTLTLQYTNAYQHGKLVQFEVHYSTAGYSYIELIPFALLGCCGGVAGGLFIRLSCWLQRFRRLSVLHARPVLECACVALLSALLKFPSRLTRGNFTEVLETLFSDCVTSDANTVVDTSGVDLCSREHTTETVLLLLYVSSLTWLLSVYSIQLRVPAGLLIPALVSGSAFGRAVGTLVRHLAVAQPAFVLSAFDKCNESNIADCVAPAGLFALLGAASLLGGVSRLTITLAVIMLELTSSLDYLIPIMVCLLFSKLTGDAVSGVESIYERQIALFGYPWIDFKENESIPLALRVTDAMTAQEQLLCLECERGYTISELRQHLHTLHTLHITGSPLVNSLDEMRVVGYVTRAELQHALAHPDWVQLRRDDEAPFRQSDESEEKSQQRVDSDDEESDERQPLTGRPAAGLPNGIQTIQQQANGSSLQSSPAQASTLCFFLPPSLREQQNLAQQHAGYVSLAALIVSPHRSEPLQVNATMTLQRLHDIFCKLGLRYALVLHYGRLQGIVTKKDMIQLLKQYTHR